MKLSSDKIEIVRLLIRQSDISLERLEDDILDHLCCVVEDKMEKGKPFDVSVAQAVLELAPEGMNELQRNTVYLLNSSKVMRMKKIMYTTGLLSAMAFVSGWVFGVMHWPGAWELSIYGFLAFSFVYLPLMAFDHFKGRIRRAMSEQLRFILGLTCGLVVGSSILLKVLHLPGAEMLLLAGSTLFVFAFLPYLFFNLYKKSES